MRNIYKPYDSLADVYEFWSTGDPAYVESFSFYVNFLKSIHSPIVELGIGTGRIALELSLSYQKKIIGIDESSKMLEIVHHKYKKNKIENRIELICADMSEIFLPYKVNAIYLPFRTIGHILERQKVEKLFQNVYDSLKVKGYFLFDHYIFCEEWAKTHDKKKIKMFAENGCLIEDYYEYDFVKQIMNCKIYMNDNPISHFMFCYHEPEYYIKLLEKVGFTIEKIYGEFDGSLFNTNSCNQIYICRK